MTAVRSCTRASSMVRVAAALTPHLLAIAGGLPARAQDVIVVDVGGDVAQAKPEIAAGRVIVVEAPAGPAGAEDVAPEEPMGVVEVRVLPADGAIGLHVDDVIAGEVQPPGALTPEEQQRLMIAQQIAQLEPPFTSELNSQLELIRTLRDDIPEETRRRIVAAGEAAAKEAAKRTGELAFAQQQVPQRQVIRLNAGDVVAGAVRGLLGLGPRQVNQPAEPPGSERFDGAHHLAAALGDSLEEHLGESVAREFEAQMLARDERLHRAVVHKIVSLLDDDLCLSSQQAEAIEAALVAGWNDSMHAATMQHFFGDGKRSYPGLPRTVVVPHLDAAQRERFGGEKETETERMVRDTWSRMWQVNRLQRNEAIDRDPWWYP